MTRSVFYVSDSTAMTAKGLGKSLMCQFDLASFKENLRPYVDSLEKVDELARDVKTAELADGLMPIVFASMMDENLMSALAAKVDGVIDIITPFLQTLEVMMQAKSSKAVGRAHASNFQAYKRRIESIDFTMAADDGLRLHDYDHADVILLGVSRTGKTPTALYLALNFGLKVANYPFTGDDLPRFSLHDAHVRNRHKLIGLTISAERLANIRRERRPESNYADYLQISLELDALNELFARENIERIDTSSRSVEEIAAMIMNRRHVKKISKPR